MRDSNVASATKESAQVDFSHSLLALLQRILDEAGQEIELIACYRQRLGALPRGARGRRMRLEARMLLDSSAKRPFEQQRIAIGASLINRASEMDRSRSRSKVPRSLPKTDRRKYSRTHYPQAFLLDNTGILRWFILRTLVCIHGRATPWWTTMCSLQAAYDQDRKFST
jgi:hypothetical protein